MRPKLREALGLGERGGMVLTWAGSGRSALPLGRGQRGWAGSLEAMPPSGSQSRAGEGGTESGSQRCQEGGGDWWWRRPRGGGWGSRGPGRENCTWKLSAQESRAVLTALHHFLEIFSSKKRTAQRRVLFTPISPHTHIYNTVLKHLVINTKSVSKEMESWETELLTAQERKIWWTTVPRRQEKVTPRRQNEMVFQKGWFSIPSSRVR